MHARFSLPDSLAGDGIAASALAAAIASRARVDVTQAAIGPLAYVLSHVASQSAGPLCILTPTSELAASLSDDLRFYLTGHRNKETVLRYPAADATPFVELASDRRSMMDRLFCLYRLAHELPAACLIAPMHAALRRAPPPESVRNRSLSVALEDELDIETMATRLSAAGYLRVPVVEDPGSFAIRGAIVDVFPPQEPNPYRIELDFDMVASIRRFDADDQRTLGDATAVALPPARDITVGPEELSRAEHRVSELCDALNIPTSRRKQLVADIGSGRQFPGIDAYQPAFFEGLVTLFDYLPDDTRYVVIDPTACAAAVDHELARAHRDHGARMEDGKPSFAVRDHYLSPDELEGRLLSAPVTAVHRLAVAGDHEEDGSTLAKLESITPEALLRLSATDQESLESELKTKRMLKETHKPLSPLVERLHHWADEGLHTLLCARTQTQATRLVTLLKGYGVAVDKPMPFDKTLLEQRQSDLRVVIGTLNHGAILPHERLSLVTEEEIFGHRQHRKTAARRTRDKKRAFVEDLRQLSVGDYVVHDEHGIGRYLGLTFKHLPLSRYEELQGKKALRVEVLTVEYLGGDKLYVPVIRLNQIQKFSGSEGQTPKLDKLGGQTFDKKKSKVLQSVKQLADELLSLYAARAARKRPRYPPADELYAEFEATFPYEETDDQARAIADVLADMESDAPMDRLICGDVGFGKTEVAMRAAFRAAMASRQVAILCPTTVLAQQHLRTFEERFADYPIKLAMLSRFVQKKEQTQIVKTLKEGNCDVVIGTHRLLSKDVHFKDLGLLVVDEEQHFGVAHKERIKKLRTEVDVLTLSATPIPRTLQMAIGGLRELSLITTPPVDRRAVRTFVTRWDDHVIREAMRRELSRGGQIYFIHNRIERLYERAAHLQELVPDARIATVHGRMKEATLEVVMNDFIEGRYDVLCATAIVENGLDIPRANTIIIDRADAMGLAQLYQLRGRVGRSKERAYCYLITRGPSEMTDEARSRIEALERYTQLGAGFQVASLDMEQRGAGDILGSEQSGSIAAVGFEMFVRMLEEAVAELRGVPVEHGVETELTITVEHYLPEDYVPDVGVRLSLYKRFASADSEDELRELTAELEDRFGPPPPEAAAFLRVMELRPALRHLRVLGCEASTSRVTLHLQPSCPVPPPALVDLVRGDTALSLSPEMKLTRRFVTEDGGDAIEHVHTLLHQLLQKEAP